MGYVTASDVVELKGCIAFEPSRLVQSNISTLVRVHYSWETWCLNVQAQTPGHNLCITLVLCWVRRVRQNLCQIVQDKQKFNLDKEILNMTCPRGGLDGFSKYK